MTDSEVFNFGIPKQPQGDRISAEEAECLLLEKLKTSEDEFLSALWDLAVFYNRNGQQELAQKYFERLITCTADPEKHAAASLALGQLMEQMENYEAAISFYTQAFSLEPENTPTWYLINNNLGYCLNHFERYAEGEGYCRRAIEIDPDRQNAYKNLGLSLVGQGQYAEAARNFILATHANARDPRALKLLEQLHRDHAEIAGEIPDIEEKIKKCQAAVKLVSEITDSII